MYRNDFNDISRHKAVILLVITAVFWSLGGLLIKVINLNALAIAGIRSAIAAIVILVYLKKPKITWSYIQIFCAVAYAGTVLLFVIANKLTTAANAILLQYSAPIYVALFSAWFLKEKITSIDLFTTFFVMGGIVLFFINKISAGQTLGNALAIISGISFAGMIMLLRKQKDGSPLESILLGNIITALIGLPFTINSHPAAYDCALLAVLGILQLGIPYIIYSAAIKHVTAIDAALIPVLEPVLNPVWVLLATKEKPDTWSLIGGIIVLLFITGRSIAIILLEQSQIG